MRALLSIGLVATVAFAWSAAACAPFKFNGQPDRLYCVVVPPEAIVIIGGGILIMPFAPSPRSRDRRMLDSSWW